MQKCNHDHAEMNPRTEYSRSAILPMIQTAACGKIARKIPIPAVCQTMRSGACVIHPAIEPMMKIPASRFVAIDEIPMNREHSRWQMKRTIASGNVMILSGNLMIRIRISGLLSVMGTGEKSPVRSRGFRQKSVRS